MLYTLRKHVLDILAADSRLLQGGTAYNPGGGAIDATTFVSATPAWAGVKRPANGADQPASGYVNVFESSHEPSGGGHRPAIYVGSRQMGSRDRIVQATVSGGAYREIRVLILPLIVAAQAAAKQQAEAQREQLLWNMQMILMDHVIEAGYWHECIIPGESGGGSATETTWTSATGAAPQGVAEAMGALPLEIRYTRGKNSPP
jgi:hypothetical protein